MNLGNTNSALLYAVHKNRATQEYEFVNAFKEERKNAIYSSTEGFDTWFEAVRMRRNDELGNIGSALASRRRGGNADVHDGKQKLYASAALRNVLENIFK